MKHLAVMMHFLIIGVIFQIIQTSPHKVAVASLTSYEVQQESAELKLSDHALPEIPIDHQLIFIQDYSTSGSSLIASHTLKGQELLFTLHNSLPPPRSCFC